LFDLRAILCLLLLFALSFFRLGCGKTFLQLTAVIHSEVFFFDWFAKITCCVHSR